MGAVFVHVDAFHVFGVHISCDVIFSGPGPSSAMRSRTGGLPKKCTQKAQELLGYSLTTEPLGYSFSEKGLLPPPRFLQVNICITGDGKKIELFLPLISHLHSSYDRYENHSITRSGE